MASNLLVMASNLEALQKFDRFLALARSCLVAKLG